MKDGKTFLDLVVEQNRFLHDRFSTMVPLVLMNSFNTHEETRNYINNKYKPIEIERINSFECFTLKDGLEIIAFNQSRFPRILADSLLPAPSSIHGAKEEWQS